MCLEVLEYFDVVARNEVEVVPGKRGTEYVVRVSLAREKLEEYFGRDVVDLVDRVVDECKGLSLEQVKNLVYELDEVRRAREGEVIVPIPKVRRVVEVAGLHWYIVEVDPAELDYWCEVLPPEYVPVPRGVSDVEVEKVIRKLDVPDGVRKLLDRVSFEKLRKFLEMKLDIEEIEELIAEGALG